MAWTRREEAESPPMAQPPGLEGAKRGVRGQKQGARAWGGRKAFRGESRAVERTDDAVGWGRDGFHLGIREECHGTRIPQPYKEYRMIMKGMTPAPRRMTRTPSAPQSGGGMRALPTRMDGATVGVITGERGASRRPRRARTWT